MGLGAAGDHKIFQRDVGAASFAQRQGQSGKEVVPIQGDVDRLTGIGLCGRQAGKYWRACLHGERIGQGADLAILIGDSDTVRPCCKRIGGNNCQKAALPVDVTGVQQLAAAAVVALSAGHRAEFDQARAPKMGSRDCDPSVTVIDALRGCDTGHCRCRDSRGSFPDDTEFVGGGGGISNRLVVVQTQVVGGVGRCHKQEARGGAKRAGRRHCARTPDFQIGIGVCAGSCGCQCVCDASCGNEFDPVDIGCRRKIVDLGAAVGCDLFGICAEIVCFVGIWPGID